MITTDVPILNNTKIVPVRRLGLFELDDVPKDIPGPYTVTILFQDGTFYEQPFDMSEPRPRPDIPMEEAEEGSQEFYDWREHLRYQEGLEHNRKQFEAYCDYCERVAKHIRDNCLPDDFDRNEIVDSVDWTAIYHAALCPQVQMEDIAAAMRLVF